MDRHCTHRINRTALLTMTLAGLMLACVAQAAELYSDQILLAAPEAHAAAVGKAKHGEVTVLERQGYWVHIQEPGVSGWTQLSNVAVEETTKWMDPPVDVLRDTGRLGAEALKQSGGQP